MATTAVSDLVSSDARTARRLASSVVPPRPRRDFARWYRTSALPLVAGAIVIMAVMLGGSELALSMTRRALPAGDRLFFLVRAAVTAALLGGWTGWVVYRTRARLDEERMALRRGQERLREEARTLDQTAGLAAVLRVMAHEVRHPLHALNLQCRLLERRSATLHDDQRAVVLEAAGMMRHEVARLSRLVDDYLAHGRATAMKLSVGPVDVDAVVGKAIAAERDTLRAAGVTVFANVERPPPALTADGALLVRLLQNLLRNAAEVAHPDGGRVLIEVRSEPRELVFTVTDDGPGFVDLEGAFRPFYTTKADRTGLGLAVVRDIARAHRGSVSAENLSHSGGARVEVRIASSVPS